MRMIIGLEEHYKPHIKNVKVLSEDGSITGLVAWWSNNPIEDAIIEAKRCVIAYEKYGIAVKRIVTVNNKPIFTAELHPLREKNCGRTILTV